jgi:hypothetical protein
VQALNNYAKKYPAQVIHKKIFPITAQEYVSAAVFALTIFNGADQALFRIFKNAEWDLPELNKKGSNSAAISANKTSSGEAFYSSMHTNQIRALSHFMKPTYAVKRT